MTSMLNLVIHLGQSLLPPLKPWVSKSLVPSNHVKILHLAKPNNEKSANRLLMGQFFFEERLFFDISSPSTPTFGSKKHWLLVVDDSSDYIWSFFLKEKSDLADMMISLIKNLKNKYNMQVQYLCWKNAGAKVAFKKHANKMGWG